MEGSAGAILYTGSLPYAAVFGNENNYPVQFGTNNAIRMTVTSGGNVGIGTTAPTSYADKTLQLHNSSTGSTYFKISNSTSGSGQGDGLDIGEINSDSYIINREPTGTIYVINSSNGVYLASGGVAWIANSDERLKADLMPIENALNKVDSLRSVIGRYKTDEINIRRPFLIAQDVLKVLPEAVTINKETGNLGVSYSETIPLLVAAIKELSAKNEALIKRIETLENK